MAYDSDDEYHEGIYDHDGDANARDRGSRRRNKPQTRAKATWEGAIRRDFGGLKEGEDGLITGSLVQDEEARKRKRLRKDTKSFQRGIIRHVILVLDMSEAMLEKDMRPNRYLAMINYCQDYVREFFEQNPISQMAIMGMHDGIAIRISELSGNPSDHVTALKELRAPRNAKQLREPTGSPSLQNALELARASLYHTPSHGTREVILIMGALYTNDPGDIHKTIAACVKDHLRVSIIGMGGRMKICQEICARTNAGDDSSYGVVLDQLNFRELLRATTTPPVIRAPASAEAAPTNPASLLMMGFPSRVTEETATLCACHGTITRGGYTCSRCRAKVCALPATCPSCHLTLILSTHLARSYHHLFPLQNWAEVSWARARAVGSLQCKGCLSDFPPVPPATAADADADANGSGNGVGASSDPPTANGNGNSNGTSTNGTIRSTATAEATAALPSTLPNPDPLQSGTIGASESGRYECQDCGSHYCVDCDLFCHEVAHNCPGCLEQADLSGAGADGEVGEGEPRQDGGGDVVMVD